MNLRERDGFRTVFLREIYLAYHAEVKSMVEIDISKDADEKIFALRYFEDKGYITKFSYNRDTGKAHIERLTAMGIDEVEG